MNTKIQPSIELNYGESSPLEPVHTTKDVACVVSAYPASDMSCTPVNRSEKIFAPVSFGSSQLHKVSREMAGLALIDKTFILSSALSKVLSLGTCAVSIFTAVINETTRYTKFRKVQKCTTQKSQERIFT